MSQDNINQTTSYLYALEKQLSQHQKHLLLRFANTSHGVMNSLEELTCGLCDNVLGADDADAAGGLAEQRLGYHVWPVIERFRRLQHRLTTGFLHAT